MFHRPKITNVPRWAGHLVLLSLIVVASIVLVPHRTSIGADNRPKQPAPRITTQTSVDVALGEFRRRRHEQLLEQRLVDGRVFPWRQYAKWGEELIRHGCVQNPPTGKGPSRLLAKCYRCVHCHNLSREDVELTKPSPDARATWILAEKKRNPKSALQLTTGTTLWGAVNRREFYNGFYEKYRTLKVADGRAMNCRSLADAIQVCTRYCSCGRFAEQWELDAMLAYLWELELRICDTDVSAGQQAALLKALNDPNPGRERDGRVYLREHFLQFATAVSDDRPKRCLGDVDVHGDGGQVTGVAKRGRFLYESACAGCHGSVHPDKGSDLVTNFRRFHRHIRIGTEGGRAYMPRFTKERMSRQQLADIRAYLRPE